MKKSRYTEEKIIGVLKQMAARRIRLSVNSPLSALSGGILTPASAFR